MLIARDLLRRSYWVAGSAGSTVRHFLFVLFLWPRAALPPRLPLSQHSWRSLSSTFFLLCRYLCRLFLLCILLFLLLFVVSLAAAVASGTSLLLVRFGAAAAASLLLPAVAVVANPVWEVARFFRAPRSRSVYFRSCAAAREDRPKEETRKVSRPTNVPKQRTPSAYYTFFFFPARR